MLRDWYYVSGLKRFKKVISDMMAGIYSKIKMILLSALLTSLFTACSSVEEVNYKLISKDKPFEIRDYSPYIVAEIRVKGSLEDAGNVAFRPLFKYISGENESRKKIAMTAPVSQKAQSEKIPMTAPVSQQRDKEGWTVAFAMPASYTMETVPRPVNKAVRIREVPGQKMAGVVYSGTWSEKNYKHHLAKLESWIKKQGFSTEGEAVWARYNPPFTLWFLRRNEILIPIKQKN